MKPVFTFILAAIVSFSTVKYVSAATYGLVYTGSNTSGTFAASSDWKSKFPQISTDPTDSNVYVFGTSGVTTGGKFSVYTNQTPNLRFTENVSISEKFYLGYKDAGTTAGAARLTYSGNKNNGVIVNEFTFSNLVVGNAMLCLWGFQDGYTLNGSASVNGEMALDYDNKAVWFNMNANLTGAGSVGFINDDSAVRIVKSTITSSSGVTVYGSRLILYGNNAAFTGTWNVESGLLRAANANALGTGTVKLSDGGILQLHSSITSDYSVKLAGTGNIDKLDGSKMTVSSAAAGTSITLFHAAGGTVEIAAGQALSVTTLAGLSNASWNIYGSLASDVLNASNTTLVKNGSISVGVNAAGNFEAKQSMTVNGQFDAGAAANTTSTVTFAHDFAAKGMGLATVASAVVNVTQTTGTVKTTDNMTNIFIGKVGTSTWNISGGSVTSARWLNLGYAATGNGTLNLSGTATANSAYGMIVGEGGKGTFSMQGNSFANFGSLSLGHASGGTATLNLAGGTFVTPLAALWTRASGTPNQIQLNGGAWYAKEVTFGYGRAVNPVTNFTSGTLAVGTWGNNNNSTHGAVRMLENKGADIEIYDLSGLSSSMTAATLNSYLDLHEIGTMNVYGGMTLTSGSIQFDVQITEDGSISYDQLFVRKHAASENVTDTASNGTLTLGGTLDIDITGLETMISNNIDDYEITLFTAERTLSGTKASFSDINITDMLPGLSYDLYVDGNSLVLGLTRDANATPEPASWILLLLGGMSIWAMKRTKK